MEADRVIRALSGLAQEQTRIVPRCRPRLQAERKVVKAQATGNLSQRSVELGIRAHVDEFRCELLG